MLACGWVDQDRHGLITGERWQRGPHRDAGSATSASSAPLVPWGAKMIGFAAAQRSLTRPCILLEGAVAAGLMCRRRAAERSRRAGRSVALVGHTRMTGPRRAIPG
jgi:hypothetical protein